MFGRSSRLNPLESRKQLLLAESELNRAQLVVDLAALAADVGALTDRAKTLGSLASSAAMLVAGLAAFRRGKPADAGILVLERRLECGDGRFRPGGDPEQGGGGPGPDLGPPALERLDQGVRRERCCFSVGANPTRQLGHSSR